MLKQMEHWMMLSFTRVMASARRRAWSAGLRRMKNVSRWAVLGPIPGSFASSSISADTGAAVVCMFALLVNPPSLPDARLEARRQLHTTRKRFHHFGSGLGGFPESILTGGQDEVLEQGDVFGIHDLGGELDGG